MTGSHWLEGAGLIISIITAGSIIFAARQIVAQTRQMHREFESLYVERYWELMDKRSVSFLRGSKPRRSDQFVIFQYLQLCEDEVDQRGLGRVTDETWGHWEKSIRAQVQESAYSKGLRSSSRSDFPSLKKLVGSPTSYDPLTWSRTKRRRKGL